MNNLKHFREKGLMFSNYLISQETKSRRLDMRPYTFQDLYVFLKYSYVFLKGSKKHDNA